MDAGISTHPIRATHHELVAAQVALHRAISDDPMEALRLGRGIQALEAADEALFEAMNTLSNYLDEEACAALVKGWHA